MFIWVCPPAKGDEYIFFSHPQTQKSLDAETLREWYLRMLRKAQREGVVHSITNLYKKYFENRVGNGYCSTSIKSIPYYEGDVFTIEVEKLLAKIKHDNNARKNGNIINPKFMFKLSEIIEPMQDNLIVVRLQPFCSICLEYSGDQPNSQWFSSNIISSNRKITGNLDSSPVRRKTLNLCKQCYKKKFCRKAASRTLQIGQKTLFALSKCKQLNSPYCLKSIRVQNSNSKTHSMVQKHDLNHQRGIFYSRLEFLALCQEYQYQFDTLLRAKHSTMMILYNLKNPEAHTVMPICQICKNFIEKGNSWRCEHCSYCFLCWECFRNYRAKGKIDEHLKLHAKKSEAWL